MIRRADGSDLVVETQVLVAATGKATRAPLYSVRTTRTLDATIALSCVLKDPGDSADATIIEAVPEGWWWWLPLHDGQVCLTLFADAEAEAVREQGRLSVWNTALASARGPARGRDARPESGVEATPRLLQAAGETLLVGDASSTIDPLSSQGLEKAFASAEETAFVVNTILDRSVDRTLACVHHQEWEAGLFDVHAARTREFYAEETRFGGHPFWDRKRSDASQRVMVEELPRRLRRNASLEESVVLSRGDRVLIETPGLKVPGSGPALARIGDVPIGDVVQLLDRERSVPEVLELAAREPSLYLLSRGLVEGALRELLRLDFLQAADR